MPLDAFEEQAARLRQFEGGLRRAAHEARDLRQREQGGHGE
jgi:hypothetical protein